MPSNNPYWYNGQQQQHHHLGATGSHNPQQQQQQQHNHLDASLIPPHELENLLHSPGGYIDQARERGLRAPRPDGSAGWEARWLNHMLARGLLAPIDDQNFRPEEPYVGQQLYGVAMHGPGGYFEQAKQRGVRPPRPDGHAGWEARWVDRNRSWLSHPYGDIFSGGGWGGGRGGHGGRGSRYMPMGMGHGGGQFN